MKAINSKYEEFILIRSNNLNDTKRLTKHFPSRLAKRINLIVATIELLIINTTFSNGNNMLQLKLST